MFRMLDFQAVSGKLTKAQFINGYGITLIKLRFSNNQAVHQTEVKVCMFHVHWDLSMVPLYKTLFFLLPTLIFLLWSDNGYYWFFFANRWRIFAKVRLRYSQIIWPGRPEITEMVVVWVEMVWWGDGHVELKVKKFKYKFTEGSENVYNHCRLKQMVKIVVLERWGQLLKQRIGSSH